MYYEVLVTERILTFGVARACIRRPWVSAEALQLIYFFDLSAQGLLRTVEQIGKLVQIEGRCAGQLRRPWCGGSKKRVAGSMCLAYKHGMTSRS